MEFDATFNPAVIVLGAMVWIGIFGLVGNYLSHLDCKRGHCATGITEKQIQKFREYHGTEVPLEVTQIGLQEMKIKMDERKKEAIDAVSGL